ncbi:MAG: nicotinate-nucleotide adenylyltransferase [Rhodocyclales bacterium]|nr:nicotinate-nucleotide adenylyltransferase [Rhodocyclales bacterium]MBI5785294.1 nicotinate-nucleotide adenylyltransferase [Rhodocyclales bacterium]
MSEPLGILGGTFDPIHTAHLRLAEEATRQLRLGGMLWIPAGQPRHRTAPLAAPEHRLAMVRAALAGHPEYRIDDTEVRADAPSYTVPTLERLRRELGGERPLVLLMGADAFLGLAAWHRWRELFQLAHIGVASRPGFDLAADAMPTELAEEFRRRHRSQFTALATAPAGAVCSFPLSAGTVSSTEVRTKLQQGAAVDQLLPAPVLDYIRRHRLYSH